MVLMKSRIQGHVQSSLNKVDDNVSQHIVLSLLDRALS